MRNFEFTQGYLLIKKILQEVRKHMDFFAPLDLILLKVSKSQIAFEIYGPLYNLYNTFDVNTK